MPGSYGDDLRVALSLADAADEITLRRFAAADLQVDTKPDLTPVTDADRLVELELRAALQREFPGDAVAGEEFGEQDGAAADGESCGNGRRWILDPIDGTKNFLRGVPVWATLIALEDDDRIVVGVVSAPALGRRWWAARGDGAHSSSHAGTRQLRVSAVNSLADAFVSYSSTGGWHESGRADGFAALLAGVWRSRAFGDFWSHVLVAEGSVDVSCEPEVSLWDLAPLQVIVEEAGGRFTDLSGHPTPAGGSVVCSNGMLHSDVLQLLQPR